MGLQVICRKRGIPMRVLLLVLVVLTWTPAVASAQANLCDPNWLERASSSEVRALLRGGADVNQICNDNRNRPLHQAILTGGVSPGVFRALVEAGADILAENIDGSSPLDYAEDRFARAERNFQPGSGSYRREETIYMSINRAFEAAPDTDRGAELCDVQWWRTSASASSVRSLLQLGGGGPNRSCNQNEDTPLHLVLGFLTFARLPAGVKDGVLALVAGGASPGARNRRGRTPLALAEERYDRVRDRSGRGNPPGLCRNEADPEVEAYIAVRSSATGEPAEDLAAAARRELCGGRDVPRTAGATFRECEACPEMVVMPGGRLALGRYEVTVGEYGAFASATGGGAGGGCFQFTSEGWTNVGSASWRNPGFSQTNSHPVVCVSWHDAQEYVSWLTQVTGTTYRLPSEGEWGRAAGGSGSGCSVNGGDDDLLAYLRQSTGRNLVWLDGGAPSCPGSDGARFTASVGSYGSNGVGLSDMVGNVWEWTDDCWDGDCGRRVVRGGSWLDTAEYVRPSGRRRDRAGTRGHTCGFRVARTLD